MGNLLVIDGHPDPASLTAHLATSYRFAESFIAWANRHRVPPTL